MTYVSLTGLAKDAVASVVKPGDTVVDATVGNGHDTLFLSRLVGHEGKVYGFDIQLDALQLTLDRLRYNQAADPVELIHAGHEELHTKLPASLQGKITAVMFNLGYLPGGDKQVITQSDTTLRALEQATNWLGIDGITSILAYRGHPGGKEEWKNLERWLNTRSSNDFSITRHKTNNRSTSPVLYLIRKRE